MRSFIKLQLSGSHERLVALFETLKSFSNPEFVFDPAASEKYAANIAVKKTDAGCFKADSAELFRSIVWMVLKGDLLYVTNITSKAEPLLGFDNYNKIITRFASAVVGPNLTDGISMTLEGEKELEEKLDPETFNKLKRWARSCNRDMPICHESDRERWFDFVKSAYLTHAEISPDELSEWLVKNWSDIYEDKASEIAVDYEYAIDLLSQYERRNPA